MTVPGSVPAVPSPLISAIEAALTADLPCLRCGRTETCRCLVDRAERVRQRAEVIAAALPAVSSAPDREAEQPPKRRLRLSLDLDADDLDSLASALRGIAHDLEFEGLETRDTTSGGYSDGYHLTLTRDPEMTGDLFRERLESWAQAQVAARDEAS